MGAVGIETNEVTERVKLPPSNVVVATVGVDLKVVDMAGVAEKGDSIVSRKLDALTDQVGTRLTHDL